MTKRLCLDCHLAWSFKDLRSYQETQNPHYSLKFDHLTSCEHLLDLVCWENFRHLIVFWPTSSVAVIEFQISNLLMSLYQPMPSMCSNLLHFVGIESSFRCHYLVFSEENYFLHEFRLQLSFQIFLRYLQPRITKKCLTASSPLPVPCYWNCCSWEHVWTFQMKLLGKPILSGSHEDCQ